MAAADERGDPTEAPLFVGGQAVIGGVMMRTRTRGAVAVRLGDGAIEVAPVATPRWARSFDRLLVVRGAIALVETMIVGMRALSWSAARDREAQREELSPAALAATTVATLVVFTAVFAVVPALLARAAEPIIGDSFGFVVAEAVVRLALLVGYVAAIGLRPAIRETFAYHGAEHMVVAAYEAGDDTADIASTRRHSRRHSRCGTDFLLLVVVVAVVVFSLFRPTDFVLLALSRVVLLPLVAGIAYEILRLSRAYPHSAAVRALVAPGLALQALTTREPTDAQLEVANAALQAVLVTQTADGTSADEGCS